VLAVTVFFVCSRYRVPSLPVWTLFAGAGVAWAWRSWPRASWARRAGCGLAVLAAVILLDRPTHETELDLRAEEAFYRAEGAFEERDYATAGRLFEQAIVLDPRNNDAWDLLGHVRNRTGDPEGALAAWRHAAALDPLKTETTRTIADALQKRGDLDGAFATLLSSLAYVNDPRSYANDYSIDLVLLARLYLHRGDMQRALDAAQSAVRFNSQNDNAVRLRDEIVAGIAAQHGAGAPRAGQ
jgi:tetratricopeptide (TPR) repeat protein